MTTKLKPNDWHTVTAGSAPRRPVFRVATTIATSQSQSSIWTHETRMLPQPTPQRVYQPNPEVVQINQEAENWLSALVARILRENVRLKIENQHLAEMNRTLSSQVDLASGPGQDEETIAEAYVEAPPISSRIVRTRVLERGKGSPVVNLSDFED